MNQLRKYVRSILVESMGLEVGAIYCDMDGVLCHFEVGSVTQINKTLEAAESDPDWYHSSKAVRSGVRRIHRDHGPSYRVSLGQDLRGDVGVKRLSYALVGRDPGTFFRNLPAHPDGLSQLWPYLNSLGKPVHILSAPINGSGPGGSAGDGKRDWVDVNLQPSPSSVIITPAASKPVYAVDAETGLPNILVDDKQSTVQAWNDLGGIGILHQPGNSAGSISQIKQRLGNEKSP